MGSLINLLGRRFGRLLVKEKSQKSNDGRARWFCICDCGKEKVVLGRQLLNGKTQSCGCLRKDVTRAKMTTHGYAARGVEFSGAYKAWRSMLQRCSTDPCGKNFHTYAIRGIVVCDKWKSFENFYADMGDRPLGASLDRIDNNGIYEPSNCRWADAKTQSRNRRSARLVTFNGEEMGASTFAEKIGIDYSCVRHRLDIGWSPEKIASTPSGYRKRGQKGLVVVAAK